MEKLKLILLGSVLAFSNAIYAQKGDCEPLIVQNGVETESMKYMK